MKKNRRKILSGSRKILFAILAMFLSLSASAQQITASGQVLDAQNEPLIGVSVQEKGTTNGAITDLDGNFTIKCSTKCHSDILCMWAISRRR